MSRRMGGTGLSGEQVGSRKEEYAALLYTEAQKSDGEVMHEIPRVFLSFPIHNPVVEWEKDDEGMVTLTYKKNFGRFEKWLHKRIGGPEEVHRPLDEHGSKMWLMMDGEHTILDLCITMDKQYKEAMAPVLKKVRLFLERLLILNLVILMNPKEDGEEEVDEKKKEEGENGTEEGGEAEENGDDEVEGDDKGEERGDDGGKKVNGKGDVDKGDEVAGEE